MVTLYPPVFKPPKISSGITFKPCLMFVNFRNNYATFKQIKTETVAMSDNSKKAKLFITLEKHTDFDANIEKFE